MLSNREQAFILSQPEIRNKDVVKLLTCSKPKASQILKKIRSQIVGNYYVAFAEAVPAEEYIKFMKIDLDKIFERAQKETAITQFADTATAVC